MESDTEMMRYFMPWIDKLPEPWAAVVASLADHATTGPWLDRLGFFDENVKPRIFQNTVIG